MHIIKYVNKQYNIIKFLVFFFLFPFIYLFHFIYCNIYGKMATKVLTYATYLGTNGGTWHGGPSPISNMGAYPKRTPFPSTLNKFLHVTGLPVEELCCHYSLSLV